MSVRLLFPTVIFEYNLLEEGLVTQTYLDELKADMDGMRRQDPVGRQISNAYTGWQSNDGVNERPIFQSLLNGVETVFDNEVFPFYMGKESEDCKLHHGNYWVNINYQHSYNNVHTHPGCWYSGVFYLQVPEETRGSGALQFLSGHSKHMSDFVHCSRRDTDNFVVDPKEGDVLLFPSSMLHYVEPNEVDFDRISIAFNNDFIHKGGPRNSNDKLQLPSFNDVMEFEVQPDGNLEFPK